MRRSGFWWVNPFTVKKNVSLRVRNFTSDRIKVNDADGSWRIEGTYHLNAGETYDFLLW